jgi:CBS domain-containing protein
VFRLAARDLMTRRIHVLRDTQTIREAAAFLLGKRVHGAPVVDGKGDVVGVLSVTDLARFARDRDPDVVRESDYYRLAMAGREHDIRWRNGYHLEMEGSTLVREVMTSAAIFVRESASFRDVLRLLLRHRIHRVLVLRGRGRALVGVVSETDLLRALGGRRRRRRK